MQELYPTTDIKFVISFLMPATMRKSASIIISQHNIRVRKTSKKTQHNSISSIVSVATTTILT